MALVRWEPIRESRPLQREFDRLFGTFFDVSPANGGSAKRFVPAIDLRESDDSYVLTADLPGVEKDDIKVELADGVLTIAGERRAESAQAQEGYQRIERASGSFTRSLTLPKGTDPASLTATYVNGVLTVRIPKPVELAPHRVEITSGGESTD